MAYQLYILAFIDSNGDQNIYQQVFDERDSLHIPDDGIKAILLANYYNVEYSCITDTMVKNAVLQKALNEPPQYYALHICNNCFPKSIIGPFLSNNERNKNISEIELSINDDIMFLDVVNGELTVNNC